MREDFIIDGSLPRGQISAARYKVTGVYTKDPLPPRVYLQVGGNVGRAGIAYIAIGFKTVVGENTVGCIQHWEVV